MVKKYSILLVILILAILGLGCTRKESKESLAKTEDPIKAEDSIKTEDSVKVEDPVKAENPKKAEDQEKADGSVTADDPTKTEGNRESDIGTEKESLRKFSLLSEDDINQLSDDEVLYLATHKYKTNDFVDDFRWDSYSDFGTPLDDLERFEPVLLDLGGERQDYDVNKKISDQDFRKLTEEYMSSFKEHSDDMEFYYIGETDHYVEYRYSTSQQIGSGRRCFYRNMFMVSEMIDGSFYAGPVYLGELTVDNVLSEGDFYLSSFFDSAIMWRGVKENMTSIVYTYYCPNWKQIGDYDEYGENEKAEILKSEIIYDKETHRITQESIVIHSVDIPDTKLYIPEPV